MHARQGSGPCSNRVHATARWMKGMDGQKPRAFLAHRAGWITWRQITPGGIHWQQQWSLKNFQHNLNYLDQISNSPSHFSHGSNVLELGKNSVREGVCGRHPFGFKNGGLSVTSVTSYIRHRRLDFRTWSNSASLARIETSKSRQTKTFKAFRHKIKIISFVTFLTTMLINYINTNNNTE